LKTDQNQQKHEATFDASLSLQGMDKTDFSINQGPDHDYEEPNSIDDGNL